MPRKDLARGRLWVADSTGKLRDCGLCITRSGGKIDSDEQKHRSGGGEKQRSLGGPRTRENVVITADQDEASSATYKFLKERAGTARAEYHEVILDAEQNPVDEEIYVGTLKSVEPSERDANSGDPAVFEAEISTDGV